MVELTLMYRMKRTRGRDQYGDPQIDEFNAVHVVRYWLVIQETDTKENHLKRIETFKYRNFFRHIMGEPLLKPRKYYRGRWSSPKVVVEFVGRRTMTFYYDSNRVAEQSFTDLDDFMKGHSSS